MKSVAPSRRPRRDQAVRQLAGEVAPACRPRASSRTGGRGRSVRQLQDRRRAGQAPAPPGELRLQTPRQPATPAARPRSPRTGPAARRQDGDEIAVEGARARGPGRRRPAVRDDVVERRGPARAPRRRAAAGRRAAAARARGRTAAASRPAPGSRPPPHGAPAAAPARSTTGSGNGAGRQRSPARGRPRRAGKVVRSASWRRTTSASAPRQRRRRPAGRAGGARPACCRARLPGSSWSRNQSRCWAKESGRLDVARHGPDGRQRCAAVNARASAIRRARPAGGRLLEQRPQRQLDAERLPQPRDHPGGQQRVAAERRRSRRAAPTRSTPSSSAQSPATISSSGRARRLAPSPPVRPSATGGERPAVHLAVGGQRQRRERRRRRPAPCSPAGVAQEMRPQLRRGGRLAGRHDEGHEARRPARPDDHRRLRARRDARRGAASISPGSMRKPRILTWSSARPRNSSAPSAPRARQVAGAVERAPAAGGSARSARPSGPAGRDSRAPPRRRRCRARRARRSAPGCRSGRAAPARRRQGDGRAAAGPVRPPTLGARRRRSSPRWVRRAPPRGRRGRPGARRRSARAAPASPPV